MFDLAEKIAQVDVTEIEEVLIAVRQRYAELFPDWEVVLISIEKSVDRNRQLDRMIAMLQNMKTPS